MRHFVMPVPQQMQQLPRDRRGFPVPWFVQWIDGEPHFPIMDVAKLAKAIQESRCWVCGGTLWANKAFVIGPMCCVNRVTAEPPCHVECATFSARCCPFMAAPKLKRSMNPGDIIDGRPVTEAAGIAIDRNPGVACVWVTQRHRIEWEPSELHGRMPLFRLGPAKRMEFYAHGRLATFHEVAHSVTTGLPILVDMARQEGEASLNDLAAQVRSFEEAMVAHQWPIAPDVDLRSLGFSEVSP